MNRKIVTLILVILISFCFLSIVVADNALHHDKNTTADHGKTVDKDKKVDKNKKVDNKTTDKNKKTNKNKTTDKSNKNYILATGSGNDITFSDGFRGFKIDFSKPSAKTGDKFKRASASSVSNSNSLKLGIIESYLGYSGYIGNRMTNIAKENNTTTYVGDDIGDHEVVIIDKDTEAIFDFEVLKSATGNTSDYFAYKVSFRTIENQTDNLTNQTNKTNNATNTTNITQQIDNGTNVTGSNAFLDYLASLANALYNAWKPIVDTLINDLLMIVNAIEGLADLFTGIMVEIHTLMEALGKLLEMLESIFEELAGLLKLLEMILDFIQQIIDLIESIINFIMELISAIISLIMELLEWLFALIEFLLDLLNQIIALIMALLNFLKSVGSFLIITIENIAIIMGAFVIFTIGAFVYNRIR